MKNKGFTLIELLAVIVILAIIALIAVPIIINIINDARESGYKRSIDNYGKAVEQAIGTYQISNPNNQIAGTYTSATLEATEGLSINYEGSRVVCSNIVVNENGTIYISGCSVGGHSVVGYTYGIAPSNEEPAAEPEDVYAYLTYTGSYVSGPSFDGDASALEKSAPTDKDYYLKFKLNDESEVIKSEACVKFAGEEYCVEGGGYDETTGSSPYYGWDTDVAHSTGNVKKLYDIQQAGISGVSCSFDSYNSVCSDGSVSLSAQLIGDIYASGGDAGCYVGGDGSSYCGIY